MCWYYSEFSKLIGKATFYSCESTFLSPFLQGPPPDPQYNFLSDRTRDKYRQQEKPEMKEKGEWNNREPPRRHPKNFGGSDFNNVKSKMKQVKDRQVS